MQPPRWVMLLCVAAACAPAAIRLRVSAAEAPRLLLRTARAASSDLEIAGLVARLKPGATGYVGYEELTRLPQVDAVVDDDPDLPGVTMHVKGVALDELARAVGADPGVDLIDANCADNYRAYYPREMIAAHRPILVLTIDGLRPEAWAAKTGKDDPGPYLVLYEHFRPAWKVLSHEDKPQLPTNVVRLTLERQADAFGRLEPKPEDAGKPAVRQGWQIAEQNCIRCHADGDTGGTKSPMTWTYLAREARDQPQRFAQVIRDPKSVNPGATMEGSSEYDDATLAALTAYFRTFAEGR